MSAKKMVLKLDIHDDKAKQKAMQTVSSFSGIESVAIDMKDKKLTVIGDVDPCCVVTKLKKKQFYVQILTVGPAKEEKKSDGQKKEDDEKKKKDEKTKDPYEQFAELLRQHPYLAQTYFPRQFYVVSADENPNACAIL